MVSIMSCYQVAHQVLLQLKQQEYDVSPLKLLKLIYISHGYHLALADEALLHEYVEAWKYGPVVREIYSSLRGFGDTPVPLSLFAGHPGNNNKQGNPDGVDTIKKVVAAYGKFDGLHLSAATHKVGTPWHKIYHSKGENAIIPDTLIQEYYKDLSRR